jgi:uncharacterized protein DUF6159
MTPADEPRLRRSVRLTRCAWRLLRTDRTMLALGALGALVSLVAALVVFTAVGYWHDAQPPRARMALVTAIAAWPVTFAGVFLNVALAAAADAALDGRELTLREALGRARAKTAAIAVWSLLVAGIGVLLSELAQRLPFGGRLAQWALGGAWSLLTIFAIPVLALEGCGARACLQRSAGLLRGKWGEGAAGVLGIGAISTVAAVIPGIMLGTGAALMPSARSAGVVLVIGGAAGLLIVTALAGAVRQIFAVALYRYAVHAATAGPFAERDLQRPFTGRSLIWPPSKNPDDYR